MHLQPAHADVPVVGGDVSAELFATGVTLPYVHRLPPHGRATLIDDVCELPVGLLDPEAPETPPGG